ncbi:deoxyribodipyrimidine photo-lyase [Amycolatopsis acidicola]|uniref:Deoxyribodipyrimidine photo-lyase n=1 Tax=Amycolatopsis acidicola TaxID=2596893 RepID=A0A5N0UJM9_9PSEU|nr:deoxyribodipyrimidine photo-lyase [Amycolatopsis acidicola]KAA9148703.1 deoxyribodipyrimidine photo-lyase [Amycolatopsis acidicola]
MASPGETAVLWFRRDLRLGDHAALLSAGERAERVLALFVLDDKLIKPSGAPRLAFLYGCLRELSAQLGGRLLVVHGDPAEEVCRAAKSVGAKSVHVTADTAPYGVARDREVAKALERDGVEWVETGSPYAVTPGRVTKPDGDPYKVFTAFYRSWRERGWHSPARTSKSAVQWIKPDRELSIPDAPELGGMKLPKPGEKAALKLWKRYLDEDVNEYDTARDRPDHDATTRLSPYLHWGCVHPRTLLADLAERRGGGAETLRSELAWREFYADVLWHRPDAARRNYDKRFDEIQYNEDDALFEHWRDGRTGYPIVDAGMRQLLAEGWMHNRVRMIVASFLVKDLHLPWWFGARHFMRNLVDGDLASNQLNWQWVAGSGNDAAPYFRVFNPTTQGEKFDPQGDYVRRFVPELRGVAGKAVHQPWKLKNRPEDYPAPVVEHAQERQVALERFQQISRGARS